MKVIIGIGLFVLGSFAFYFIWPHTPQLPKIGAVQEWTLTEVNGKDLSMQGKPKLVTFFYTNCPDICPMTMWDLTTLQQLMQEEGYTDDQFLLVSVTLDPEYDTVERIEQYKEVFAITSPNWLFLRGTEEETLNFARNFNFFYDKDADGFVTHATTMYIVDADDQIRAHHIMAMGNKQVNIQEVADHLQQLIR
ncbi:SCO family protein [Sporosarcina soli]|uniref:SCO family protein n=1 Tax=Sporosarcina soli TaxID=334736 RepID=A0ABW0TSH0_9BACL